jgi:hypothetical protein
VVEPPLPVAWYRDSGPNKVPDSFCAVNTSDPSACRSDLAHTRSPFFFPWRSSLYFPIASCPHLTGRRPSRLFLLSTFFVLPTNLLLLVWTFILFPYFSLSTLPQLTYKTIYSCTFLLIIPLLLISFDPPSIYFVDPLTAGLSSLVVAVCSTAKEHNCSVCGSAAHLT